MSAEIDTGAEPGSGAIEEGLVSGGEGEGEGNGILASFGEDSEAGFTCKTQGCGDGGDFQAFGQAKPPRDFGNEHGHGTADFVEVSACAVKRFGFT